MSLLFSNLAAIPCRGSCDSVSWFVSAVRRRTRSGSINGAGTPEGFVRFSLLYYGDRPKVEIYSDGSAVEPSNVNYRMILYFGQKFMTEESLSVPGNEIAVFAYGAPLRPSRFDKPCMESAKYRAESITDSG